jgi:hypothetical protein
MSFAGWGRCGLMGTPQMIAQKHLLIFSPASPLGFLKRRAGKGSKDSEVYSRFLNF